MNEKKMLLQINDCYISEGETDDDESDVLVWR